jgi:hypothetical protein
MEFEYVYLFANLPSNFAIFIVQYNELICLTYKLLL